MFGAYFGLAASRMIYKAADVERASNKEGSVYHSDLFAMIGKLFRMFARREHHDVCT